MTTVSAWHWWHRWTRWSPTFEVEHVRPWVVASGNYMSFTVPSGGAMPQDEFTTLEQKRECLVCGAEQRRSV